jgi:hypothetical protein
MASQAARALYEQLQANPVSMTEETTVSELHHEQENAWPTSSKDARRRSSRSRITP